MHPSEIYSTLSDIKIELDRRNKDEALKQKVADFLGKDFPLANTNAPHAVLARTIVSPNMELRYFMDVIGELGLPPLFLEYSIGKMVSKNKEKYYLCKPTFFHGTNTAREIMSSSVRAVNLNVWEGKPMSAIYTPNNIILRDFHHTLTSKEFPAINGLNTIDISDWFNEQRYKTDYYYLHFLAMFIHHGVLFENFLLDDEEERKFAMEKLKPSLAKIKEMFGVAPLIFPLLPTRHEKGMFWYFYPKHLKEVVEHMLQ